MNYTNREILEYLHTLVSYNVIGGKQLFQRYKGFKAELHFSEEKVTDSFYEGGMIISNSLGMKSSLDEAVYFSVISHEEKESRYLKLYESLSKIGFTDMFLVKYSNEGWKIQPVMIFEEEHIELPVPKFEIYNFSKELCSFNLQGNDIKTLTNRFQDQQKRGKNRYPIEAYLKDWLINKLGAFSHQNIIQLYVERLIFDGYIGFSKKKGKPSDIDFIVKNRKGDIILIEVKEKDLPKYAKRGFGIDVPRLEDFQRIQNASGLRYLLIVRHVRDQRIRDFIAWLYIFIDDFLEDVRNEDEVEGGTGMRSTYSSNPTLICAYEKFKKL